MFSKIIESLFYYIKKIKSAYRLMSKKEKWVLFTSLLIIIVAGYFVYAKRAYEYKKVPQRAGVYKEGVVGIPDKINPLLATNDAEKSLVKLTYQGLYYYNKKGRLATEMVKRFEKNKDKTVFKLKLKDDLQWSDGHQITADDIISTVKLIKDNNYSGLYKDSWQDIKLKKVNNLKVRFETKTTNPFFKDMLTVPFLPNQIVDSIEPERLSLHEINKKPISSGPYLIDKISNQAQVSQVFLKPNPLYNGDRPYISKIVINCYPEYSLMIEDYKQGQINSLSYISIPDYQKLDHTNSNLREIYLPQLTAAFFNSKKGKLRKQKVRRALSLAVDREEIVQDVLNLKGRVVNKPYVSQKEDKNNYRPVLAKDLLKQAVGKKDLSFNLLTSNDSLQVETAQKLKKFWQELGVEITIEQMPPEQLGELIVKNKNYDILLFGYNLGAKNNLISYWHSSQIKEGYNFSKYSQDEVDFQLEEFTAENLEKKRNKLLNDISEEIESSYPAAFLYSASYLHLISKDVKNSEDKIKAVSAPDRFNRVDDWYIKEKKVRK